MTAALLVLLSAVVPPGDEVVHRALGDEMARSMKELQIPSEPRPHYVRYVVTDVEEVLAVATFGARTAVIPRRWRSLSVEVRVGDRTFDSGNFADPSAPFSESTGAGPVEDDYLALRRALWLQTDQAFKRAVDVLAKKRAAEKAQAKGADDAPVDFAEAKPVQVTAGADRPAAKLDPEGLGKIVTELSGLFRGEAAIHSSRAAGQQLYVRQRLLTSDGGWKDERRSFVEITVDAETQADDGMPLRDGSTFQGATMADLPAPEAMNKTVKAMAATLSAARRAPVGESGAAVVLFDGPAAGQLLRRMLGDHLSGTPPPRTSGDGRSGGLPASELATKLGQRIAPPFLDVYDDPTQAAPAGSPLFGAYQVDDEGVPAERVTLVSKGTLQALLMSRTPRKELLRSNGHGRGLARAGAVRGHPGVLVVSGGKAGVSDEALRAQAVKEAQSAGKDTPVYIVRHLDTGGGEGFGGVAAARGLRPLAVARLRDGKEEPIRGITFTNLLPRSLKDLVAIGKQPTVYNYLSGADGPPAAGTPGTVITPALVFKDVEVRRDTGKHPRPPLYPHPYFADR